MIKETNLCMGCMNDKDYEGPCKFCGYSDDDPCIPTYLAPKTFLNERYVIGKLLSYNGEGATYIGCDLATNARVTVKEFMPDTLCARRKGDTEIIVNADNSALYKTYMSEFEDLHRSLIKLRGMAHVQSVLDIFQENGTCYAVMEYISGISLKTFLENSGGALSWEQVKELFPPILTTLSLIHAAGTIHRGISPQTIFVTDKMELMLANFSISAGRTTSTEIACEIYSGYAAPEQYTNEVNGTWTDVYGISAVLYRVLTAAQPAEAIARTPGSLPEPAMINPSIPTNVSKAIMSGMRLSTDKRVRTVTELVDRLFAPPHPDAVPVSPQRRGGIAAVKREEMIRERKKKDRQKTIAALIIVGVIIAAFIVVFTIMLVNSGKKDEKSASSGTSSSSTSVESSSSAEENSTSSTESSTSTSSSTVEPPAATWEMPDFTDKMYASAVENYKNIFTFVKKGVYSDEHGEGDMFDQSVPPGEIVPVGTTVTVYVSLGRVTAILPSFDEKTLNEYIAELEKVGIKNYVIESEPTDAVPVGRIVRCSKSPGDVVVLHRNTAEDPPIDTLIIYTAEKPAPPPDVSSSDESSSSDDENTPPAD